MSAIMMCLFVSFALFCWAHWWVERCVFKYGGDSEKAFRARCVRGLFVGIMSGLILGSFFV